MQPRRAVLPPTPELSYSDKLKRGVGSLRNKSKEQRQAISQNLLKEMRTRGLGKSKPMLGGLYFYAYSAKHKDELEYWDAFPLMMPIKLYPDGFLGLNFHYLHPVMRAKLMDAIVAIGKKTGTNERQRVILSYDLLAAAARTRFFAPCVKRYLTGHVRSKLLELARSDWDLALMLPLARFQKAGLQRVYADSRKTING